MTVLFLWSLVKHYVQFLQKSALPIFLGSLYPQLEHRRVSPNDLLTPDVEAKLLLIEELLLLAYEFRPLFRVDCLSKRWSFRYSVCFAKTPSLSSCSFLCLSLSSSMMRRIFSWTSSSRTSSSWIFFNLASSARFFFSSAIFCFTLASIASVSTAYIFYLNGQN